MQVNIVIRIYESSNHSPVYRLVSIIPVTDWTVKQSYRDGIME